MVIGLGWKRVLAVGIRVLAVGILAVGITMSAMAGLMVAGASYALAQEGPSDLPDAPGVSSSSQQSASAQDARQKAAQGTTSEYDGKQTKRILGIIPNFRSVSADAKLPPMTVKEKFSEATQDSFDYSSIVLPAVVAGYDDARRSTPEFGHGGIAYGRYLWHVTVDQTVENYAVEFIGPAITHQDPRYYTKGRGGFVKRTGYALSRVVITRSDDDREVFNSSEVIGALGSAGLANLYYPSPERTFGNTMTNFGTSIGIDALTFMVHEFWPDINGALFHMKD
jgi:hypothetical protein